MALQKQRNRLSVFFIGLFLLYLLPICFNYANDRYLLFLIPIFIISYIQSFDFELNKKMFFIAFLPIFYFSFTATFDYFSFNKARWKAIHHLTEDLSVDPKKIDGGFEFNAFYLPDSKKYIPTHQGRWWWIEGDDYIISPKKRKGYFIQSAYKFQSLISFSFDEMYILKKKEKN